MSCDVCFNYGLAAVLYRRMVAIPMPYGGSPQGCQLSFGADGQWQLMVGAKSLLAGNQDIATCSRRRVGLRFKSDQFTAVFDGKDVDTVANSTYGIGLAGHGSGYGSGYEQVKFDNLRIDGLSNGK